MAWFGSRWKEVLSRLSPSLMLLLLWVALVDLNQAPQAATVDGSWSQAMGHFLKHRFQAGEDYLFTYGPLGYFLTGAYDADLFWWKYAWELLVKLVFALTLVRVARRLPAESVRWLFCLAIVAFAHQTLTLPDCLYAFVLLARAALLLDPAKKPSIASTLFGVAFIAVLALTKFTLLVFALAAVTTIAGCLLITRARFRAFLVAGGFCATFVGTWLLLGQNVMNLPRYFHGSVEIASGYVEAMLLPGERTEIHLAWAIGILLAVPLLMGNPIQYVRPRQLALVFLVALGLFFQWKNGFIRHDHHSFGFFAYALLIPFLLPALFVTHDWKAPFRVAALSGAWLLAAAGTEQVLKNHSIPYTFYPQELLTQAASSLRSHLRTALHPGRWKDELDQRRATLAKDQALPNMRARIQDAAVDILSFEQGVLLLNNLNWRPRPVFQDYSAYTPFLQSANARFFASARAPEYVIFKLQTTDARFPTLEEGQSLLQVLRHYRPVLFEKSYWLFQRNPVAEEREPGTGRVLTERRIAFNQEVVLTETGPLPQQLFLDIRYSVRGKLKNLLFKPSALYLWMRTDDGQARLFRFIPGMARDGFLLNPVLLGSTDVIGCYGPCQNRRAVSFMVIVDPADLSYYQVDIPMTLQCLPDLCSPLAPAELNRLLYSMFSPWPMEVRSTGLVENAVDQEREILQVHPDGCLTFPIPPGANTVTGQYGILPEAYESGTTDGVQFVVEYVPDEGSPRVLFARHLDPRNNAQDRGRQMLEASLPAPCRGRLLFKTRNLPGHNNNWDWSYWTGIRIE